MPAKEFNIDDYQYIEEHISFKDFLGYKPRTNHLDPDAAFNGTLYRLEGPQWEHISQLPVHNIWTLYADEDGQGRIRNGYQVRGGLGYFHADYMHNAHATIVVDDVDISSIQQPAA